MKRIHSVFILLLICALLFTGCNSDKEDDFEQPPVGTTVGSTFPTVSVEALDGRTVSPDDYRGRIVIVNVWATWCGPCKMELPDFNRIATEYKDEVVIIAAHTPSGRENAENYVAEGFPNSDIIFAYDTDNSSAYYAAGGKGYVPQTAIIDQRGVIIYSDSGIMSYAKLKSIIDGLLE